MWRSLPSFHLFVFALGCGFGVVLQVLTGQAEMPAEGMTLMQNPATKLACEVFVGNIPPETQAPTLQVDICIMPKSFVLLPWVLYLLLSVLIVGRRNDAAGAFSVRRNTRNRRFGLHASFLLSLLHAEQVANRAAFVAARTRQTTCVSCKHGTENMPARRPPVSTR